MSNYFWNAGPQTINVGPEDLERVEEITWIMNPKKKHIYSGYIIKGITGIRHGKGRNIWPTGPEYIGDWNNDLQHGRGAMQWPNGDKYKGNWQFGAPIGHGEVIHDGKIIKFFDMRPDGYMKNEYGNIIGSYRNDRFIFW